MRKRLITLIPFLLISVNMLQTWANLLFDDYVISISHWLGLGFYSLTFLVYFRNFKYGILLTGVILFLATFNVISFFTNLTYIAIGGSFGDSKIYTPGIQPFSLLILILYVFVNFSILKDFWEEMGPENSAKK